MEHDLEKEDGQDKYLEKIFAESVRDQMGHDVANTWTYLVEQQQNGMQWVAYPDQEKVSQEDLQCFRSTYEAQEYCYENNTDVDRYEYNHIDRVQSALAPLMEALIDKHIERYPPEQANDKDEEMER